MGNTTTHCVCTNRHRLLYYVFALASIMVGMLSTHGLGGRLRHGAHIISQGIHARRRSHTSSRSMSLDATADDAAKPPDSPRAPGLGWSFFQPFSGGTLFIATQGVGWAFFAACILLCGWGMYAALRGVAHCVQCWVLATGFSMFSAQLAVGTSVFLFQGGASATRKVRHGAPYVCICLDGPPIAAINLINATGSSRHTPSLARCVGPGDGHVHPAARLLCRRGCHVLAGTAHPGHLWVGGPARAAGVPHCTAAP